MNIFTCMAMMLDFSYRLCEKWFELPFSIVTQYLNEKDRSYLSTTCRKFCDWNKMKISWCHVSTNNSLNHAALVKNIQRQWKKIKSFCLKTNSLTYAHLLKFKHQNHRQFQLFNLINLEIDMRPSTLCDHKLQLLQMTPKLQQVLFTFYNISSLLDLIWFE